MSRCAPESSGLPTCPVRNVVFDFGGVLINWKPERVVAEVFADPATRSAIMRSVFHHPDWLELDRGSIDENEAVNRFAARSGVEPERIRQLMGRIRDSLTLIPETAMLVRTLADRGVPVYGLSNMSEPTFALLEQREDIWSAFTGIVISGAIGMVKPERGIFQHLVSTYGVDPAETVFVDDHAPNIDAADCFGFQTILFSNPAECIDRLGESLRLPRS